MKKKNLLTTCSIAAALFSIVVLFSCNNNKETEHKTAGTAQTGKNTATPETILYKAKFKTLMGVMADEQLTLTINTDGNGTYETNTTYPDNTMYEGKKLENYHDKGTFTAKESSKFGTIYIFKGLQPVAFYYQVSGDKLNELGEENGSLTGVVLYKVTDIHADVPTSASQEHK
jgi:hypothetical protein